MKTKSSLRSFLCLAASALVSWSFLHAQTTYTWDSSNVTGTPAATLDWFTGGSNPLGVWTGPVVPLSDSNNTIRFFADTTTSLPNTVPATQTVNLNNGGSGFQLGTLALNGFGSTTSGASLTMTLQGDALNFSGAAGTISFNSRKNVAPATDPVINYTINNNIQLGTASSSSALTLTGNGDGSAPSTTNYIIGGAVSELQTGGGSLVKSGSSAVTISGAINLTGAVTVGAGTLNLTNNTNTASSFTVNGGTLNVTSSAISASMMTVNGGTLVLTGNLNPASGSMTVNSGGILRIGNNTATQIGVAGVYAGNISTGTGGTLQLWSTSAQTLSGVISGSGGISKAYNGTLTLSGANTFTGKAQFIPQTTAGFTVNVSTFNSVVGGTASSSLGAPTTVANGTIDLGSPTVQAGVNLTYVSSATGETTDRVINLQFNGNNAHHTLTANNASGLLRFTSAFTSNGGAQTCKLILSGTGAGQIDQGLPQLATSGLDKQGAGTWTLGGSGIFTGPTLITAGTLSLSSATALQFSPFNTASVTGGASAGLKIATTTLSLGGLTGSNAFDSRFTTTAGGYSGLAALTLTNAANTTSTYSGNIVEGATGMTLTKTGLGTQFLNGTNSYTGLTTVNAGTLASGTGFSGAVTASNGGILSPGASAGSFGTLTISSASASALTLNGGILQMDVSTAAKDLVAVTGDAVLNGTNTILLNPTTGVAIGTYDLVTYNSTTGTGSVVFANGTTTLGNATLAVNAGNIQMIVGAGGLNNSVWVGTTATWDSGTNWNRNGTPASGFSAGDFVTIDDTGSNAATITSVGTVSPAALTVNNSSKAFTISATIGGTGTPLIKLGSNTLTLSGTNTYDGGTVINAGTLSVTANANLGATSGGITLNGGQLRIPGANISATRMVTVSPSGGSIFVNKNNNFTTSGILTGSGTLTLLDGGGSGTLSTYNFNSTSNDFTGGLVLNNAILNISRLDDSANNIVINSNTSSATGNVNSTPGLKYNSSAASALTLSSRAVEFSSAVPSAILLQNNNITHAITVSSDLVASGAGAKTLMLDAAGGAGAPTNVFSGKIADGTGGGTVGVVKPSSTGIASNASTSTWVLSGNNSYTGATAINTGTLAGIGANAFGSTSGISMAAAGILSLRGDSSTTFASSNVTTSASGATINVDRATVAGTEAKTMTMGTLASTSTGTGYQVNFTGANNTSLSVGAVSGAVSTATGTVTLSNTISGGGQLTVASYTSANTNGGETLVLTGTGSGNLSGSITPSSTTLSLRKNNGAGSWVLSGSSSFTGTTDIQAGILSINSIGNVGGGASALGAPTTVANGTITIGNTTNAATLVYTGSGHTTDRVINLAGTTGGATLSQSGSGLLKFTSNLTATGGGVKTLTLQGSTAGIGEIAGAIVNNSVSNTTAVTKSGTGTWVLSGSNTYTGNTTVSAGTLALGANDVLANSTNVSVSTATLDVATFTDTVGTLDATAAATINFGTGGALAFANSSAVDWTDGTLNITGTFVSGSSIRFGTTSSGLTSGQLAVITVNGSGAGTYTLDESGYLVGGSDTTAPTLTSIADDKTGGPVNIGTVVTYTVTFSEDIDASTVDATDFGNAGTATASIGTVTETSPGVFTVQATASTSGTMRLRINAAAVIKDVAGNDLDTTSALLDDTTLTVRTPFEAWANAAGATGGSTGDPDGDGFVNLMEYGFDTNPTSSSAASIAYSNGVVTAHGQPILVVDNGFYYAVFGRRVDHVAAGLTYTVEFSAGLNQWEASSSGLSTVATDGTIDAVRVPFPITVPTQSGPMKPTFFRVVISQP